MNNLRDLFHKPAMLPICGVNFVVYKLAFEQFDDAIILGTYVGELEAAFDAPQGNAAILKMLEKIKAGTPERAALERLVAGCLSLSDLPPVEDGAEIRITPLPLQPADVAAMPMVMVAEAVVVLMGANIDFFFRSLPNLITVANRIKSIGSELPSSLSALATA